MYQIRDAFAAKKIRIKGPYKIFDEKVKSCFSKFVSIMANAFQINKAAVSIFKESGGCCFQNEHK